MLTIKEEEEIFSVFCCSKFEKRLFIDGKTVSVFLRERTISTPNQLFQTWLPYPWMKELPL